MGTEGLIKNLATFLAPITENVTNILCRNQSIEYVNAFANRTSWAMRMWDSSAKMQAGLLTGNMHSLGNFDECLSVTDTESASGNFSGQYCLATISLLNTSALDLGALLSQGLRWGYCIPSSCNSTDISTGLSDHLSNITGIEVTVKDSDCSIFEETHYTLLDSIAWGVIVLLMFLITWSTLYEIIKGCYIVSDERNDEENRRNEINRRRHRTSPPHTAEGPLDPNAPVRRPESLDLPGPQLRPRSILNAPEGNLDNIEEEEHETDPAVATESTPLLGEGTPKVLESPIRSPKDYECDILTSFSLISNAKHIFTFNDSRLLLTSVDGIKFLSLCWVVLAHAWYITGTLPALNYISVFEYSSKWSSILILNTQLAVDTFLVCTGVLISYNFLNDMNRRGIQQLPNSGRVTSGMNKIFMWYFPVYYLHRYFRLAPALAMMVLLQASLLSRAGSGPFWASGSQYLSEMCQDSWWSTLLFIQNIIRGERIIQQMAVENKIRLCNCVHEIGSMDNRPGSAWIAAISAMAFAIFGMIPYVDDGNDSDLIWRSFFSGTYHTIWALGVGWTIFACETHHGGLIHSTLSQKVFQPLRQLTYCTYLVHLPLMTHRAFLSRVPIHVNKASGTSSFLGDLLFSLIFACTLSLMVELPFARLFKTISLLAFRTTPEKFLMRRLSGYESFRIARDECHARLLRNRRATNERQERAMDSTDSQDPNDQPAQDVSSDPTPSTSSKMPSVSSASEELQPRPSEELQPSPSEELQPSPSEELQPSPSEELQPSPSKGK
ncbi:hypothetical protein C0J52_08661 [Blattella germanica]|nr:hypothetical protein C0J52_08661 [Blattella germanica]